MSAADDERRDGTKSQKKRILMLISDTGGGHRASAQAIDAAIQQLRPGSCEVHTVDVFTDYCPWPYNSALAHTFHSHPIAFLGHHLAATHWPGVQSP